MPQQHALWGYDPMGGHRFSERDHAQTI